MINLESIDNCPTITKNTLFNMEIYGVIIVIGSNHGDAKYYTDSTINSLADFGEITVLNCHISADYTNKTDTIYLNTGIVLKFNIPMIFDVFLNHLKDIEKMYGRIQSTKTVILDLDIVAVYLKNWYVIEERLPLKTHEKICLSIGT